MNRSAWPPPTVQEAYTEPLRPNFHQGLPISQEANVGHLAPDPVRGAASPPTGTAPGHAVAIGFARSTIGDGDGAKATTFFIGERTAFKVERVGIGAEGQQSSAEGENAEGTHDERWVLVEWLWIEDAIWGSCFGGLKETGKASMGGISYDR